MYSFLHMPDSDVDAELDRELRDLLCSCFSEPEDHVFRERRYFREMPAYRWLVRGASGELFGHTAVHCKELRTGDRRVSIGGVAEVCVRADHRRLGLARRMLDAVDQCLIARGTPVAVLFGDPRIYKSSGYRIVDNLFHRDASGGGDWVSGDAAMIKELVPHSWPREAVFLDGPTF